MTVAGKTALVTGAARGIGEGLARELARRGARVSLVGLEPERLEELAGELGEPHTWFEADITDADSLTEAVAGTVERLGGIDVLVANAGIASFGTVATTDPDAFARTIEINLVGQFRTVRAVLPAIRERRGYILVIASIASLAHMPGMSAYSASKAGVEAFADSLRGEVGFEGVDVGTAHPSWVDTDMVRDTDTELRDIGETRQSAPGFLGGTVSLEECSRLLADGIERRSGRIYVPRSAMVMQLVRSIVSGPIGARVMRRRAREMVPKIEAEVARLGRSVSERTETVDTKL
jgi:NAD(P)-dependent dehydrogenase (short-subunit alcohol dehydrogenase family)